RLGVRAQQVWIDLAAGEHDGVEVVGFHLIQRLVDLHCSAPVFLVPAFDLALLGRRDHDRRSGGFELVARNFELRLLKAMRCEDEHLFTRGLCHGSNSLILMTHRRSLGMATGWPTPLFLSARHIGYI